MTRTLWSAAVLLGLLVGCSDDEAVPIDAQVVDARTDAPVDAPVDAAIDAAGPCGADLLMTGEYIDWDSTIAAFDGVENTVWTVIGEPTRTATGAPNGRVLLCIGRASTVQISMVMPQYMEARFVADPAVFTPANTTFSIRGVKEGMQAAQWLEFQATPYDPAAAQVMVYKIGAPIPLTLSPAVNPAQRSFVSDGDDDITWTEGATGTLTLFPNRPVGGGTATLGSTSTFIGPTALPLAAGRLTIAVIR